MHSITKVTETLIKEMGELLNCHFCQKWQMVKRLCKEEEVGYVDVWDSFVEKEDMYGRDGLHLSGKGAAVFAEGLIGAVASGLGKVRYLN